MAADVRTMKTPAEQALSAAYAGARATLPGKGGVATLREDVEREQENQREQIAVDQRHLVPIVQRQADSKLLDGCPHWMMNYCRG